MPKDKVLIIDDDQTVRWTLAEALRRWGYVSAEGGTLAEGLVAFDAEQPSVVLLDVNLRDGSGLDAFREITRRQPQSVVIMITADVIVEDTIEALRGGA